MNVLKQASKKQARSKQAAEDRLRERGSTALGSVISEGRITRLPKATREYCIHRKMKSVHMHRIFSWWCDGSRAPRATGVCET